MFSLTNFLNSSTASATLLSRQRPLMRVLNVITSNSIPRLKSILSTQNPQSTRFDRQQASIRMLKVLRNVKGIHADGDTPNAHFLKQGNNNPIMLHFHNPTKQFSEVDSGRQGPEDKALLLVSIFGKEKLSEKKAWRHGVMPKVSGFE
nr:hypothetical protein Iba_chr15aCG16530 [Ipomoea batatas]